jgi:ribonucleotide reductase beta subunit family protein with ferritin-like domain
MKAKKDNLRANQGKHSALDKAYNKHVKEVLDTFDEEIQARWETYQIIFEELVKEGKEEYFNEIKYRLTDGEDPNQVILDIIDRDMDNMNGLIWFLKRRIEEYIQDDNLRRFL